MVLRTDCRSIPMKYQVGVQTAPITVRKLMSSSGRSAARRGMKAVSISRHGRPTAARVAFAAIVFQKIRERSCGSSRCTATLRVALRLNP